jgi:transposase
MHGISTWLLQQDNDPTHKAAGSEVAQWRTQHYSSVSVLPNWPPNSPDLNPIENLWSYLQAKMDENGCATFSEFKAALVLEAKSITKTYCSKLVDSMHKRIAECIRLEGAKTKY